MNINGKRRITGRTGIAVAVAIIAGTLASFPFGAQSASAESQGAEVVGTETDAAGRTVVLREGTYNGSVGFGWTKIQQRHNIHSKHTIGFVLKAPNGGVQQGEDRLYVAYAQEITCTDTCVVTDEREVRVINKEAIYASYYGVTLNAVVGITTAYCVNPDGALSCPAWVDRAIGAEKPASASRTSETSTVTTTWSYALKGIDAQHDR